MQSHTVAEGRAWRAMTTKTVGVAVRNDSLRPQSAPSRQWTAPRSSSGGPISDQLRTKAADAASALYREGRERLANNEELARARDSLSDSIRKNPLAAVGIAFTAGLLLALLTRG